MENRAATSRGQDRYNTFCSAYGCWSGVFRDDVENPPPSLANGVVFYPDPRIPMVVRDALCGPGGCGPLLPTYPPRALFQAPRDCGGVWAPPR